MNWTWIITGLSIIGVVANIYKKTMVFLRMDIYKYHLVLEELIY